MNAARRVRRNPGWIVVFAQTAAWAACLAAGPSAAAAEHAIVLPHGGDTSLEPLRESAQRAVVAALSEQGFQVSAGVPRRARAPEETRCTQIGCAAALLAAAGAELAVAVAVWQTEEGPQVNVTLADAEGNRFQAAAAIEPESAEGAARRALLDARGLQLLGPGPWIHVDGSPEGAEVTIDGVFVGRLPYRGALRSGDHVLAVRADGFAAQERELHMPLDPTALAKVEIALAPADLGVGSGAHAEEATDAKVRSAPELRAAAGPDEPSDAASAWNYVLGGLAMAGGIALATIDPLQAAARDGDCVDRECRRVYSFGGDSLLKIAAGALLAGGGAAMLVFEPLRVGASVGEHQAQVAVHGRF